MESTLRSALIAWLAADPGLTASLNNITEEAPVRTSPPWLGLVASASADWSTKDRRGREVRVALELHTRGEEPGEEAGESSGRAKSMVEHLAASGRATPVCPPDGPTAAPATRPDASAPPAAAHCSRSTSTVGSWSEICATPCASSRASSR